MGKVAHRSEAALDDAVFRRISASPGSVLAAEPDLTEQTKPIHNEAMRRCQALLGENPDPDTFDIAYQRCFRQLASKRNGKMLSSL